MRQSGVRAALAVVVVLAAALGIVGCAPTVPTPTPSPSQIAGSWHHGSVDLELDSDGSFTLSDIPAGVIQQSGVAIGGSPKGPRVDVAGAWSIGSGGNDAGGAPGVQLDFVNPPTVGPNNGLTLLVSGGLKTTLFVYLGHPDARNEYVFTKG